MTGIQKHGAMLCIHDPAAEILEKLKSKYGFEYKSTPGQRDAAIIGSYDSTLELCKIDNGKCAEFIFDICTKSGFDRKRNGYSRRIMRALRDVYKLYANDRDKTKKLLSRYLRKIDPIHLKAEAVSKYCMFDRKRNGYSRRIMRALRDVYKLYANDRDKTKKFLSRYLRKTDPIHLKAEAVSKYYMLDTDAAVSLYIEDIVVDNLGLQQSRTVSGDKVVSIDAKKTA